MSDLKARVEELLQSLGSTSNEVAESLAARNITGDTCDCHFCPVANLLTDVVGPDWKVEDYGVTDEDVKFPGGRAVLPEAVAEFVVRFDNHEFPDLVDRPEGDL